MHFVVQVLLEALLDAIGPAAAPMDSSALLNGLVEVQTQLELLYRVPFLTPAYKVTMMQQQQDKHIEEANLLWRRRFGEGAWNNYLMT